MIAADWAEALRSKEAQLARIHAFLNSELEAGRQYLPAKDHIMRAFSEPLEEVKVLVVGQDPYPTAGYPIGLAFAVDPSVRPLPRSLQNIYRELADDLGIRPAEHGDLSAWSRQGVMLLNRVLTVHDGEANSHAGKGWEEITAHAIKTLVNRDKPLVAILWGNKARELKQYLGAVHVIESAHPSPLSARRGFFGSKPFSKTNEFLRSQNLTPIDWEQ